MPLDLIHSYLRLYLAFLDILYPEYIFLFFTFTFTSRLPALQKIVNSFVSKVEQKVNKVLREFIFRSGGHLRTDLLTEPSKPSLSQSQTQRLSQEGIDGLAMSGGEEEILIEGECSMLAEETSLRWLYPWIFIVGELALLGVEESEEGNLSKLNVKCK